MWILTLWRDGIPSRRGSGGGHPQFKSSLQRNSNNIAGSCGSCVDGNGVELLHVPNELTSPKMVSNRAAKS